MCVMTLSWVQSLDISKYWARKALMKSEAVAMITYVLDTVVKGSLQ